MNSIGNIAAFVKYNREKQNLTQQQLADMTGVGLHFIRDLEQDRGRLRLDKVNLVMDFFGFYLGPNMDKKDPWQVWHTFINKAVTITKKDKKQVVGFLMREIKDETNSIVAWKVLPNPLAIEWKKNNDDNLFIEVKHSDIADINFQTLS